MIEFDRRAALAGGARGLMGFTLRSEWQLLTPRQAFAEGAEIQILSEDETKTLEALGETRVPGARNAGIAYYVDAQLSGPLTDCLLVARLLGIAPPYSAFYKSVLKAIDALSVSRFGASFANIPATQQSDIVSALHAGTVEGWHSLPPQFAYFVIRHDAVDVRYGTESGFADLRVPYMAHIAPPRKW
jgi:hypothetical protein